MAVLFLLPLLFSVILGIPCAYSFLGRSGPSTLSTSKNSWDDRIIDIYERFVRPRHDWLVNVLDSEESLNITDKSFLLEYTRDTGAFGAILEAGPAIGDKTIYTVVIPIFSLLQNVTMILSVYFPADLLSQARRLVFIHSNVLPSYKKVTMLDTPLPWSYVRQQQFDFYYWLLGDAIINQRRVTERFRLVMHPSSFFERAEERIMDADPVELRNILSVHTSKPTMCDVSSNIFRSPNDSRVLQVVPHSLSTKSYDKVGCAKFFKFVGRFIGIAIANRLPLDILFSADILRAILKKPPVNSHGKNAQIDAEIDAQIQELCRGVWDVVPHEHLVLFDEEQLGWLISGRPDVSAHSLKELVSMSRDHIPLGEISDKDSSDDSSVYSSEDEAEHETHILREPDSDAGRPDVSAHSLKELVSMSRNHIPLDETSDEDSSDDSSVYSSENGAEHETHILREPDSDARRPDVSAHSLKELVSMSRNHIPLDETSDEDSSDDSSVYSSENGAEHETHILREPDSDAAMSKKTQVVQWFWEYVSKLSPKDLRALVELFTSSPNLPPRDYKDQWIILCLTDVNKWKRPVNECLPVGSVPEPDDIYETRLFIPPYSTQTVLEDKFNQALGMITLI